MLAQCISETCFETEMINVPYWYLHDIPYFYARGDTIRKIKNFAPISPLKYMQRVGGK